MELARIYIACFFVASMNSKKKLNIKYTFVDYEQMERQKRLDDAFDMLFDEIEADDLEHTNSKDKYDHPTINK